MMARRASPGHAGPRGGVSRQPGSESARLRNAFVTPADTPREFLRRLPIRADSDLLLIPTSQITMITADGQRLIVTTRDQAEHSLSYRLKDLETRLDPSEFVRLSRSLIVNVNAISRVTAGPNGTSTVQLENGQHVAMSRKQVARLRRVLLELLG
jgi:two-component system, LytTR family, response regulator